MSGRWNYMYKKFANIEMRKKNIKCYCNSVLATCDELIKKKWRVQTDRERER